MGAEDEPDVPPPSVRPPLPLSNKKRSWTWEHFTKVDGNPNEPQLLATIVVNKLDVIQINKAPLAATHLMAHGSRAHCSVAHSLTWGFWISGVNPAGQLTSRRRRTRILTSQFPVLTSHFGILYFLMSSAAGENDDLIDLDLFESKSFQNEESKTKRRKRSNVWTFFEMVPESENNDGKPQAKCKMCGVTYMAASKYGTGNMKRHIDACPRRSSRDIGQMMLSQGSGSISVSTPKFETKQYRELLIAAIVKHELPFRFVEYSGLRSLLQYLRLDVPIISRNTARTDLVKIYNREKRRIKCMLNDSPGRISLTSDLWTSITTDDNASSNDVSVELLRTQLNIKKALLCDGEFFHLRCCAHILNLIVQDGLKDIDFAIQKVRESIKYVKGSQSRKVKFLDSTKQISLDSKKGLRQDVPTRWNSTFLMLESAIFYRRAFSHLELTDSNFKHCPSIFDWEKIEKINSLLGVFYEATCDFSGTKYPTANLYFPAVFLIYFTLKRHSEGEDDYMKTMCYKMLVKFEKYWSEFNVLLAIAVILDPRYKLHFVDFSYTKLYGDCSIEYMNVRSKISSLFMEYSSSSALTCSTTTSDSTYSRAESQCSINKQVFQEFDSFRHDDLAAHMQKSQLDLYLDEPRADRNAKIDILSFWKGNEFRYPDLACMARDILSVSVSTVASKFTFSVGERIIDQFKSALKADIVEALVYTRDWLYGEEQETQEVKLDELTENVMELEKNKDKEDAPPHS
ncbi:zinc finger BED domain-containing protein RICESLEEPER 1-like [Carya illinoinensis]|uniref:zinc finger BED domain-containing protein RICESLEEPER 1-like n=1 Tax=Carya illinoinensis TaxID=32201 RepID=UPI001C71E5D3|nr:zinc finger BED domain-containing protein RICESLEEPER 1-like [Carya illinoinensis]